MACPIRHLSTAAFFFLYLIKTPDILKQILNPNIQHFILQHENDDEKVLLLKYTELFGVPFKTIANQIVGRRKSREKLPSFYGHENIIFPDVISIEQSSSEISALFKKDLLAGLLPQERHTMIDLTGGFGVDCFFLSDLFKKVYFVEPNEELLSIAQNNFGVFGKTHVAYVHQTAEQFITQVNFPVSLIYIDPSRRSNHNKVFKLKDCSPDLTQILDELLGKSELVMAKVSPLVDIQQAARELKNIVAVYVVSVNNECKELLFIFSSKKHVSEDFSITAVNIQKHNSLSFTFLPSEEKQCTATYSELKKYLYEPSSALLKAGAFNSISERFDIDKLHINTHLYTSESLINDFPGKTFIVEAEVKPDPRVLKDALPEGMANITTRNYPLTPEELKKKTKIKYGGKKYLNGFTRLTKKHNVIASLVTN